MGLEVEERDSVAAGLELGIDEPINSTRLEVIDEAYRADLVDVDDDDGPGSWCAGFRGDEAVVFRCAELVDGPCYYCGQFKLYYVLCFTALEIYPARKAWQFGAGPRTR